MTDWARKIAEGDARALARAATGIENRDPRARSPYSRTCSRTPDTP